jgi:hypothetical protein
MDTCVFVSVRRRRRIHGNQYPITRSTKCFFQTTDRWRPFAKINLDRSFLRRATVVHARFVPPRVAEKIVFAAPTSSAASVSRTLFHRLAADDFQIRRIENDCRKAKRGGGKKKIKKKKIRPRRRTVLCRFYDLYDACWTRVSSPLLLPFVSFARVYVFVSRTTLRSRCQRKQTSAIARRQYDGNPPRGELRKTGARRIERG